MVALAAAHISVTRIELRGHTCLRGGWLGGKEGPGQQLARPQARGLAPPSARHLGLTPSKQGEVQHLCFCLLVSFTVSFMSCPLLFFVPRNNENNFFFQRATFSSLKCLIFLQFISAYDIEVGNRIFSQTLSFFSSKLQHRLLSHPSLPPRTDGEHVPFMEEEESVGRQG